MDPQALVSYKVICPCRLGILLYIPMFLFYSCSKISTTVCGMCGIAIPEAQFQEENICWEKEKESYRKNTLFFCMALYISDVFLSGHFAKCSGVGIWN